MAEVEHTQNGPVILRHPAEPTIIRHVPDPATREYTTAEGNVVRSGTLTPTAKELRELGYAVDPRLGDDDVPAGVVAFDSIPMPGEVHLVQVPGHKPEWAGAGSQTYEELGRLDRTRVAQRFAPVEGIPAPAEPPSPPAEAPAKPGK